MLRHITLAAILLGIVGCAGTQQIEEIELQENSSSELQLLDDAGVTSVRDLTLDEWEAYSVYAEALEAGEVQARNQSRVGRGAATGAALGLATGSVFDMAFAGGMGGRAADDEFSFQREFKEQFLLILDDHTSKDDAIQAARHALRLFKEEAVQSGYQVSKPFFENRFDRENRPDLPGWNSYRSVLTGEDGHTLNISYMSFDEDRENMMNLFFGFSVQGDGYRGFYQTIGTYRDYMKALGGDNLLYLSPSRRFSRLPLVMNGQGEITYLVESPTETP